ncbi:MAG: hypothetical protein HY706_02915 [Candidatus Hydrogenedentes bacterium]|nr:hypothetical protein [Candidatus Hydrogenedentota bacterium]
MRWRFVAIAIFILWYGGSSWGASIIVAASNSSPESKARADLVCDGTDDQVELRTSLTKAGTFKFLLDRNPAKQFEVECYGKHSVEWLPGDYYLGATLTIPDAVDVAIHAEGVYLHYRPTDGDAVVVTGANRCRYYFGTIELGSAGAALRIKPTAAMPTLQSKISFSGLVGKNQKGTGLYVDSSVENVCTNWFEGTDVSGFNTGVYVGAAGAKGEPGAGKSDTNWFWFSYIRMCTTCIQEMNAGVDDNVWQVNVDASLPNSTGIHIGGKYGKWYIIAGAWQNERVNKVLVLDPGTAHNVIEVHPPIRQFQWQDDSGNKTNVILGSASRKFNRDKPAINRGNRQE